MLNTDSSFTMSKSEILIPMAIPGIIRDTTISGIWHFDIFKRIITFICADNFKFQYKLVYLDKNKLSAGIIYSESQEPNYFTGFIRK